MAFGFAMAIVNTMQHPEKSSVFMSVFHRLLRFSDPLPWGLHSVCYLQFSRFFKKDSNRTIITVGFVFLGSSLATMLGLSPCCYACVWSDACQCYKSGDSVFKLAENITPPIFLMFLLFPELNSMLISYPKLESSEFFMYLSG